MTEIMTTCDWCRTDAVVTVEYGSACEQHIRDLQQVATLAINASGNPFAGEAAEILIAEARGKGERQ